ncbi:MAG TPA: antitoxin [Chloroflexota bacterium]|nr:antitoxin [Chloroflexota bacterium]
MVPKAIRDRLRIRAGTEVDVGEIDGVIDIRPLPADIHIVATAEGPVAVAKGDIPPLTDAIVRDTLDRLRR